VFRHQYDDRMSDDAMAIDDEEVNWTFSAGIDERLGVPPRPVVSVFGVESPPRSSLLAHL